MPRPRDVAFCVAVALSGFAAAYILKEWLPHLWDVFPHDSPDDKQSRSPPPKTPHAPPSDEVPAPVTDTEHTRPDPCFPLTNQTKSLPPLRTHALPPPLPSGHTLFSGSGSFIDVDTIPSSTSSGGDDVRDESASQTDASESDILEESLVDVLSPSPTHVITRRRSMRAHDLFAASHISFAELGNLVAPEDVPK